MFPEKRIFLCFPRTWNGHIKVGTVNYEITWGWCVNCPLFHLSLSIHWLILFIYYELYEILFDKMFILEHMNLYIFDAFSQFLRCQLLHIVFYFNPASLVIIVPLKLNPFSLKTQLDSSKPKFGIVHFEISGVNELPTIYRYMYMAFDQNIHLYYTLTFPQHSLVNSDFYHLFQNYS